MKQIILLRFLVFGFDFQVMINSIRNDNTNSISKQKKYTLTNKSSKYIYLKEHK